MPTPRKLRVNSLADCSKRYSKHRQEPLASRRCPTFFERDVQLTINGEDFDWRWLEQHVQESHTRLRSVAVEVTHAIREGPILMDRHVVSAIASETGTQWRIEVLAAYELSAENKIRRIHEITRMHAGEYTGWERATNQFNVTGVTHGSPLFRYRDGCGLRIDWLHFQRFRRRRRT